MASFIPEIRAHIMLCLDILLSIRLQVASSSSNADYLATLSHSAKGKEVVAAKGAYELGYGTMHPKYIHACKAKAVKLPQVAAAVKRARSPPVHPFITLCRTFRVLYIFSEYILCGESKENIPKTF